MSADIASGKSAQGKRNSYRNVAGLIVDPGSECNFIPFAIESTGRLGVDALRFVTGLGVAREKVHALIASIGAITNYYNSLMTVVLRRQSYQCW